MVPHCSARRTCRRFTFLFIIMFLFSNFFWTLPLPDDWHDVAKASVITIDSGGAGDHLTIQQGIDNATSGDILYVLAGYYPENVIVNKTITLIGAGQDNTTIDGMGLDSTLKIDNVPYVNITGFLINGSGSGPNMAGVSALFASIANISGMRFEDNKDAIYLDTSSQCTITNNTLMNCSVSGVYLRSSDDNHISSNSIVNCSSQGIYIRLSNHNNATRNEIDKASWGIGLDFSSSDNAIDNNEISNCSVGISVTFSLDNNITNNGIISCGDGISGISGDGDSFVSNEIINCTGVGVNLSGIDGASLDNNSVINCSVGIQSNDCENTTIINNAVHDNRYGIHIFNSILDLKNNTVWNNTQWGVWIDPGSVESIPSFRRNLVNGILLNQSYHYLQDGLVLLDIDRDGGRGTGFTGNFSNGGLLNLFNCTDVSISNSTFSNNSHAVVSYNSMNITVEDSDLTSSISFGIEVRGGSNISIVNCTKEDGQYFLDATNITESLFLDNFIANTSSNAIVLGKSGGYCDNISIFDTTIADVSGSGVIIDNVNNCSMIGLNVSGCGANGIESRNSTNVSIVNSSLSGSTNRDLYIIDSDVRSLNSTLSDGTPLVSTGSELEVLWFLHVKVENSTGAPLPTSNLTITDSFDDQMNRTTNNMGWHRFIPVTQYVNSGGVISYHTPHNITANNTGYYNYTEQMDMNSSKTILFSLVKYNFPPYPPSNIAPAQTHNRTPVITWNPAYDPESSPLTYTISLWNGTNSSYPILIDADVTFQPSFNILVPLDYHRIYYIEVNASDGSNGTSSTVNGTIEVVNNPPFSPVLGITGNNSYEEIICTIVAPSDDIDTDPIDPITYTYKWYRNGLFMPSLSVDNASAINSTVPPNELTVGDNWTCRVIPGDGIDTG